MPPKAKQPANGKTDSKPKPTPAATAASSSANAAAEGKAAQTTITKPDNTAYHAEQDAMKKEIDQLQAKLVRHISVIAADKQRFLK